MRWSHPEQEFGPVTGFLLLYVIGLEYKVDSKIEKKNK